MPPPPITLASSSLFKTLTPRRGTRWRRAPSDHLFAAGEAIVRQDAEGDSMFVLMNGQARVVLEPSGQEVAVIPAGGFFGEMSMLTGDRRTATVKAMDDVTVLEIVGEGFPRAGARESGPARSRLDDHQRAAHRPGRRASATAAAVAAPEAKQTFLARMRQFLDSA